AAAEQIGAAAAEQQKAAEGDRVRRDHPLQSARGEMQLPRDRRQRNRDDRDVEHGHEERHANNGERQPATWIRGGAHCVRVALGYPKLSEISGGHRCSLVGVDLVEARPNGLACRTPSQKAEMIMSRSLFALLNLLPVTDDLLPRSGSPAWGQAATRRCE